MALILSIETSTPASSVALHKDGDLIAFLHIHISKSHSQYLAPSIEYLFKVSGMAMKSIDAVAISEGPGSYTGLRIGTSTAKGVCYALDAKLIAVNTLKSMANGMAKYHEKNTLLCPMIDARRMEVYCLVADTQLNILEPTTAKIIDEQAFSELLQTHKMVFFGNGAMKCKPILEHHEHALFIDGEHPSAEQTGYLAWKAWQRKKFEDPAYFEPFYLKDFIAKKPSGKSLI